MALGVTSVSSTLILVIIAFIFGAIEGWSLMAGVVAAALGFIAAIICLIGLVPFVGAFIYAYICWTWLQGLFFSLTPVASAIPITMLLIFVVSTIAAIIYTIFTSFFASALIIAAIVSLTS